MCRVLVPSVPQTLVLWERRRQYARMAPEDVASLDCHIVLPDLDSVVLLCKDLTLRRRGGRRVVFQKGRRTKKAVDHNTDDSEYAPPAASDSSDDEGGKDVPRVAQPVTPGLATAAGPTVPDNSGHTEPVPAKPVPVKTAKKAPPRQRAQPRRPQRRQAAARRRLRRLQGRRFVLLYQCPIFPNSHSGVLMCRSHARQLAGGSCYKPQYRY